LLISQRWAVAGAAHPHARPWSNRRAAVAAIQCTKARPGLQYTGSYVILLAWAAGAYLVAVLLMHMILPGRRGDLIAPAAPAQ